MTVQYRDATAGTIGLHRKERRNSNFIKKNGKSIKKE